MRKWIIRVLIVIVLLAVIGTATFIVYWSNPMPAQAAALAAMQSTVTVTVTVKPDQIIFMPQTAPKAGFVFYPGARVDPAAYSVIMHGIANRGYAVFVLKIPLNLALLGVNRAGDVIAANPSIPVWAVGGHSLGGVAACSFAADTTFTSLKGVILFASYPASSMASKTNLSIVSISGSNDGLATSAKIADAKALLPATTQYVVINGGNHGQFGDYGAQDGDNPPTISANDQATQTINASVALLDQISSGYPSR